MPTKKAARKPTKEEMKRYEDRISKVPDTDPLLPLPKKKPTGKSVKKSGK